MKNKVKYSETVKSERNSSLVSLVVAQNTDHRKILHNADAGCTHLFLWNIIINAIELTERSAGNRILV